MTYRVTGNLAGAVYLSFTVELGSEDGGYSTQTAGVLRDADFDVAADGSFEIFFGGPERAANWLALPERASELIVRCYFEEAAPAAADPNRHVPLTIDPIDTAEPVGPPDPWDDASVAAAYRRVIAFIRNRTLEQPKPGEREQPSWVSSTPNEFPKPELPGDFAFAAFDAAYSMAPYTLAPDEALVITGRWPECRFANVSLWNRYLQTYDYAHRPAGRNRANTELEPDGTYRIVIAHEDPGMPNWIDTEGRGFGLVFWRFFMPEGDVETPHAQCREARGAPRVGFGPWPPSPDHPPNFPETIGSSVSPVSSVSSSHHELRTTIVTTPSSPRITTSCATPAT